MPASLIIIAALTCFILWFRCLLLSIALGYDLQWQVLEVRRQPLIMQLQLVEAEMCCGLSLKGSYVFLRGALAYIKELGGERPGPDYPILPEDLSIPSNFILPPSTSHNENSTAKIFILYSFCQWFIYLDDWSCKGRPRSNMNTLP